MATCFIGIGSNIDAEKNLLACAEMLEADYPVIDFSSVYASAPRDRTDQDDFLNAVAKIETEEKPEEIFETLRQIEKDLGKDPPFEKGPRTIDLDILLYENSQLSTFNPSRLGRAETDFQLVIPHPRMKERRFVLEPLTELTDDPRWKDALKKTLDQDCEKTDLRL